MNKDSIFDGDDALLFLICAYNSDVGLNEFLFKL